MKLSKTQRIAAIAITLACIVIFLFLRPAPLPVDSDVVKRGPLQDLLEGEGVTRVNERYIISAPVTGNLLRVKLEEGDSVRKGSALASILPAVLDTRDFREASLRAGSSRAVVDEAVAREKSAMLNLEQAKRRAERYKNLYNEGAVSRESYEIAEKEAGVLLREADAARSGVAAARYNYQASESRVDSRLLAKAVKVLSPV
ncbi:MAG: efflux transporter periplasmic adaptor subunit, partial [Chlorobiaceae bacterium]|nr:efflux transporter periplasmic adaptor subunit [Chlorobiaceae bacterium]